ncbi:hypothetical protein G5V57_21660 [Nordella sp. HKS 07]|nr:hypothetical protein [Nordella sp. HKS 07]QIG50097.1 hypothetical protein G5V57_21660 [Nordella sp. HKS 07]
MKKPTQTEAVSDLLTRTKGWLQDRAGDLSIRPFPAAQDFFLGFDFVD